MVLARWQATIVDDAGNIQDGASVEVRREVSGAPLASIFSDRAGTVPMEGNPFLADSEGFAAFHVAGGAYRITATKGSFSRTLRYVAIGTAAEFDLVDISGLGVVQNVDAGYALAFETETSAPPSAGAIRFNNADLSAATEAYVSVENLGGSSIEARLLELFDANRTVKDTFSLSDTDNNTVASWQIDGAAADGSPAAYVTLTISAHAGETSFSDSTVLNFQPNRAGADGEDGEPGEGSGDVVGPAGATDGNLPSFDGTTGKVIQDSGIAAANVYRAGGTDVAIADGGTGQSTAAGAFNALKQAATESATGVSEWSTTVEVRAAGASDDTVIRTRKLREAAALVALTDAATVAIDWTAGINFSLTITTNRILGNPTNEIPGTFRSVFVISDGGPDELTFGSEYGGTPPTLDDITTTKGYLLTIYCRAAGQFLVTAVDGSPA